MKRFKIRGIAVIAPVILGLAVPLAAQPPEVPPVQPADDVVNVEALQQFERMRQEQEKLGEEGSKAAFGDWRYPEAKHQNFIGMGRVQFQLTSMTEDDIEKVWTVYADKVPLAGMENEAHSKRVPWQAPTNAGSAGSSEKGTYVFNLPPLPRNFGTIISQNDGETLFITISRIEPQPEEGLPYKTRIHMILLKPLPKQPTREERDRAVNEEIARILAAAKAEREKAVLPGAE